MENSDNDVIYYYQSPDCARFNMIFRIDMENLITQINTDKNLQIVKPFFTNLVVEYCRRQKLFDEGLMIDPIIRMDHYEDELDDMGREFINMTYNNIARIISCGEFLKFNDIF